MPAYRFTKSTTHHVEHQFIYYLSTVEFLFCWKIPPTTSKSGLDSLKKKKKQPKVKRVKQVLVRFLKYKIINNK